jgi:hypothetical protein
VLLDNNAAHGGTAATLALGSSTTTPALLIQNSGGSAVQIHSTGANGIGMDIDGNGSGPGLSITGGVNGRGLEVYGGTMGGSGVYLIGGGQGGGTGGAGLFAQAQGTGGHSDIEGSILGPVASVTSLASAALNLILPDGTHNLPLLIAYACAGIFGVSHGAGTGTETYAAPAGSHNFVAVFDANSNRQSVTLN